MPQVSGNFGPIYQTVVLDLSGNGAVSFQAQGSAIRVSNVFFRVDTQTDQAVCTIYKGQIADGNIIFNSNSGSTGGNAKGNVDLFDGETMYVRWTGGDPGATATATFTGQKIPFQNMRATNLTFDDQIAAGDGSLIFPALKSPNYQAGVQGWIISRTGFAEFANAVIRGELEVTGNNNSYILIWNQNAGIPVINLRPGDLGYGGYDTDLRPAIIEAESIDGGNQNDSRPRMLLFSPYLTNAGGLLNAPQISMEAASYDGLTPAQMVLNNPNNNLSILFNNTLVVMGTGELEWSGDTNLYRSNVAELRTDSSFWANANVVIGGTIFYTDYSVDSGKGRVLNAGSKVNSGAITTTETAVVTTNAFTFKAGRAYSVKMSGPASLSVGPNRVVQRLRKNNAAGTQLGLNGAHMISTSTGSVDWETVIYVTGSDVNCALAWTGVTGTAAFSATYQGAISPLEMKVFDVGPAGDYSGYATQLT